MTTNEALNIGTLLVLVGSIFYVSLIPYMTRR